ncbi:MAG: SBBP repeat-containing protein [Myxococcales bacterium]|nr:SBBP repeat-containing protein [Myxococcales bacterium]
MQASGNSQTVPSKYKSADEARAFAVNGPGIGRRTAALPACLIVASVALCFTVACGGDDNKGAMPAQPGPDSGTGSDMGDDDPADKRDTGPMHTTRCDMAGLFDQKCGSTTCHEGDMAQVGLDLISSGVEDRVSGAPAMCGGVLADSSDPMGSVLYKKVAGTSECGAAMPLGLDELSEGELLCMREWISGLLPPEPPKPSEMPDEEDDEPPPEVSLPHECTNIGEMSECYSGPIATLDVGMCHSGMQTCMAGDDGQPNFWGPCEGDYTGVAEDCNTEADDDCDTLTPASGCTTSWSRSYGMPNSSQNGRSVAVDSAGNVYLLGDFEASVNLGAGTVSAPGGKANIFLNKYDGFGNLLWSKTYGDTSSQFGQQVMVDHADHPILLTRSFGTVEYWEPTEDPEDDLDGDGETDIHVVKLSPDGDHIWSHVFGGVNADRAEDVAVDSDNNVYVTGTFKGVADFGFTTLRSSRFDEEPADRDVFLLKITADGTVVAAARYGGDGDDYGRGVAVDADGNIYLAGYFGGSLTEGTGSIAFNGPVLEGAGDRDIFIAKLDDRLGHLWSKRLGDSGPDEIQDLGLDSEGNAIAFGYFSGTLDVGDETLTSEGERDLFLVKWDGDGDPIFAKRYGNEEDQARTDVGPEHTWSALALDADDNIYLSTSLWGEANFGDTPIGILGSAGKTDIAVVQLDKDGSFLWGRRYGKTGTELVLDVAVDGDKRIMVTGRIFGSGVDFGASGEIAGRQPSGTAFLVKLDPADTSL